MIILIGFELDDEIYSDMANKDMHGEDILDLINEVAIEQDSRHHVWHFPDVANNKLQEILDAAFVEFSMSETRELLEKL